MNQVSTNILIIKTMLLVMGSANAGWQAPSSGWATNFSTSNHNGSIPSLSSPTWETRQYEQGKTTSLFPTTATFTKIDQVITKEQQGN